MNRSSRSRFSGVSLMLLAVASTAVAQGPIAPTEEHEALRREAGVWKATMKMWAMPEQAEPMVMQAKETNTLLGPFWLLSEFEGQFAGNSFTGRAQLGYDPVAKEYVGTWIDTMTPYLATMKGQYDPESDSLTMISKGRDPATGEIATTTNVTKFIDENTKTFTMYQGDAADQDAWKMMEIEYQRVEQQQGEK